MVFNFLMSPIKAYKLQYFMLSFFFFLKGGTDMRARKEVQGEVDGKQQTGD